MSKREYESEVESSEEEVNDKFITKRPREDISVIVYLWYSGESHIFAVGNLFEKQIEILLAAVATEPSDIENFKAQVILKNKPKPEVDEQVFEKWSPERQEKFKKRLEAFEEVEPHIIEVVRDYTDLPVSQQKSMALHPVHFVHMFGEV